MNKILLVIGLILFSGIAAYKGTRTYTPQGWEVYRMEGQWMNKKFKAQIDSLGHEGWELVNIIPDPSFTNGVMFLTGTGLYFFKRPLP